MANIFCQQCGLQQVADNKRCKLCHAPITEPIEEVDEIITGDLAQVPIREVIRQAKIAPLPARLLLIPFLFVIFLVCKAFKRPLPVNAFLTNHPKIKAYPPGERQGAHKCFPKPCAVLAANGFAPLFDYEDLATPTKHYCRLFIHKQEKIYAIVVAESKHTPRAIITFISYLKSKKALYYANDFEYPLDERPGLIRCNSPEMDETALLGAVRDVLASTRDETVLLKPGKLLVLRQKIRSHLINASLRAGYFSKRTGATRVTTCTNHAMLHAECFCSACRSPLCMGCKREYRETIYCEDCLPAGAKEIGSNDFPAFPEGFRPAGITLRASAALLDLLFFSTLFGIFIYGTVTAAPLLLPPSFSEEISWFVAQFFGVVFLVFYLTWPLLKFGRTPGQAAFGLKAVDRRMNRISGAAIFVRTGYHLLSFLFIFPAIGYLTGFFNKSKQGLHDKISGTLVITRRATAKAVMACLLILSLFGGAISGLSMTSMGTALPFLYTLITDYPQPEVTLEPIWVQPTENTSITIFFDKHGSTYFHDLENRVLTARDSESGKILWQRHGIDTFINQDAENFPHDIVAVINYSDSGAQKFLFLSRLSGTLLWEKEVNSSMFPLVTAHDDIIFIQEGPTVSAHDLNGRLLWQKDFPLSTYCNFELNGEISAQIYYQETSASIQYYIARTDGKTLWQRDGGGIGIGNGYQLINNQNQDTLSLMRMEDQKIIWEVPFAQNSYYDHLITGKEGREEIPSGFLYTINGALRLQDGKRTFNYPEGFTLQKVCDDIIILETQDDDMEEEVGNKELELLLLDPETGKTIYSLKPTDVDHVLFLSENENNLFFMVSTSEDETMLQTTDTLLIVNKKSWTTTRKILGKNLSMAQVHTTGDRILIATEESAGAYHL